MKRVREIVEFYAINTIVIAAHRSVNVALFVIANWFVCVRDSMRWSLNDNEQV